jgi:glycosyltransferase involved in cell wall biosynthesis
MKYAHKLSVITPSYNQMEYLEKTIDSVLSQNYENLEYIVIDGGSTDGSLNILKKYDKFITHWVSEPDSGQAHAINKGLRVASGDWVGWQNSDDYYSLDCFKLVNKCIWNASCITDIGLIVGNMGLVSDTELVREMKYVKPTYQSLLAQGMVLTNQAAFWKREIHQKIGYLNEELHYAFDYEWFLRVLKKYNATHINEVLGYLRLHSQTKTSTYDRAYINNEYKEIYKINNYNKNIFSTIYFTTKRIFQMLLIGEFRYLVNGAIARLKK